MVDAYTSPPLVHKVQVRHMSTYCDKFEQLTDLRSYITAAALDGGTQVIVFVLNFVSLVNLFQHDSMELIVVNVGRIRRVWKQSQLPAVVG